MSTAKNKRWYEIKATAGDATAVDINIFDEIGTWGITAKQFITDLLALDAKISTIHLHLNSPGGEVFDGIAIYEALKAHKATVNVYISGLAASMASIIALAGDKVMMSENSYYMIHQPSLGWWTAQDLRDMIPELEKDAWLLDTIEASLVNIYVKETGKSQEDISAMVKATTWMTAEEAKANGFIDEISAPVRATASLKTLANRGIEIPAAVKASLGCIECQKAQEQPVKRTILDRVRSVLGLNKPTAGAGLGDKLTMVIDSMVTDTKTNDDIIADMVSASGLTTEEVTADIDGTSECPQLSTLVAYSTVLTCTLDDLRTAAEADGCDFTEAAQEQEAEQQAQDLLKAMLDKLTAAETQLADVTSKLTAAERKITELAAQPAAQQTVVVDRTSKLSASDRETQFLNRIMAEKAAKAKTK